MAHAINLIDLMDDLKKSTDEQTARTISKAIGQVLDEQNIRIKEAKHEVVEDIKSQELATKADVEIVTAKVDMLTRLMFGFFAVVVINMLLFWFHH